ncbi:MAG: LysE family transporter [Dehalococcoidia bacterium]|nr:LysE family transporter [Dehalococcoidia bacterium]
MPSTDMQKGQVRTLPGLSGISGIFLTSFVVGLSGALMPGPLLALTVSSVAKHGFWAGPTLILGHAIAELVAVVALIMGLGKILNRQAVIGVIGIAGGAFLLWMGYGLLHSANQPLSFQADSQTSVGMGLSMVFAGLAVSVTNPYWMIWWVTVGTTYVAWSSKNRKGIGVSAFYTGHEMSDLSWYTVVSLLVAGGTRYLNAGVYKGLLIACGVSLLGLAVYFIFSGVKSLAGRMHAT